MSNTIFSEKIIVKTEFLEKEVIITEQELKKEKENVLKEILEYVELPGFRKGKVPITLIQKKYNNEFREEFKHRFEELLKDKIIELYDEEKEKKNSPIIFTYNYDINSLMKDDNIDKKIKVQFLILSKQDLNLKNREIELVKYKFTESQKKIFSDIITLYNLLNDNSVEKLEDPHSLYLVKMVLKDENGNILYDETTKEELTTYANPYIFKLLGLSNYFSFPIVKGQSCRINIEEWLDVLYEIPHSHDRVIISYLEKLKNDNQTTVVLHIQDIQYYPSLENFLNKDFVRHIFKIDEYTEITMDLIYEQLSEIIEMVEEYYSELETIDHIWPKFIDNIEVDIPEDFIQKYFETHNIKENERENKLETLKNAITYSTQNRFIKTYFPDLYERSDEALHMANLAKCDLVEHLIEELFLPTPEELIRNVLLKYAKSNEEEYYDEDEFDEHNDEDNNDDLYNEDEYNDVYEEEEDNEEEDDEEESEEYDDTNNIDEFRDIIFSFHNRLAQYLKIKWRIENINKTKFPYHIGINPDEFV